MSRGNVFMIETSPGLLFILLVVLLASSAFFLGTEAALLHSNESEDLELKNGHTV